MFPSSMKKLLCYSRTVLGSLSFPITLTTLLLSRSSETELDTSGENKAKMLLLLVGRYRLTEYTRFTIKLILI